MAYFTDMSPCTYFPFDPENKLLAVGWLESGHAYHRRHPLDQFLYRFHHLSPLRRHRGHPLDQFLDRFTHLNDHWWEPCPFMGWHDCSFCPPDRSAWRHRPPETHSYRNVFVPGVDCLFVAPEILPHYVLKHGYAPPTEFQRALLACPDPEKCREEYLSLVIENGPPSLKQFVEYQDQRRKEIENSRA